MEFILNKAKSPLVLAVLAAAGILVGLALGSILVRLYFSGGNPAIYLFTEPDAEYRYIRARMESASAEDRAVAYYALVEYDRVDPEFLIERYRSEKSPFVRRIIVWSLGFSGGGDDIAGFVKKAYPDSEPAVKKEMIRTLQRLGGAGVDDLVRELKRVR